MPRTKKPLLCTFNQYLVCKICRGYFVDATTIIECLHTFCRSCIVKLLESTKYCPVCDVQVHKSKPLLSLRSDKIIQDLVYKLVPRLFNDELQRRRDFATLHPQVRHDVDVFAASFRRPETHVCVALRPDDVATPTRYLRCPAGVAVSHLQRLLAAKYDLTSTPQRPRVDVMHRGERLDAEFTLTDLFYVYKLSTTEPINLTYRIYEYVTKQLKLEQQQQQPQVVTTTTCTTTTNNNWKEVQLRISENGEMSIETTSQNNNNEVVHVVDVNKQQQQIVKKKELPELKFIGKQQQQLQTTTGISILSDVVVVSTQPLQQQQQQQREICNVVTSVTTPCVASLTTSLKRKNEEITTTNKVVVLNNNNNNNNKRNKVESDTKCNNNNNNTNFTSPKPSTKYQPCYVPKTTTTTTIITTTTAIATTITKNVTTTATTSNTTTAINNSQVALSMSKQHPQQPQTQKLGYKTLRDPPKSWYKQIADATVAASKPQQGDAVQAAVAVTTVTSSKSTNAVVTTSDVKNDRPANKFFKMRNNMLRFLGNPASGVKPMYSVPQQQQPKEEKKEKEKTLEIKKHSIVKIDPKTLKPISEKAPENTSLTTSSTKTSSSSTDLIKINTSQVSIFNPLKLQNSPKNDQRNNKSPLPLPPPPPPPPLPPPTSPKIPKRDKPNLNFTPPNPFVPNLSSQTAPPTQFLTAPPSPPFPSYDPRVMAAAAYHNLFYHHHRMSIAAYSPTSCSSSSSSSSPSSSSGSSNTNNKPTSSSSSPAHFGAFDIAKIVEGIQKQQQASVGGALKEESLFKNKKPRPPVTMQQQKRLNKDKDKSLQNTVEKLTLSRAKEIQKTEEILKKKEAEKTENQQEKKQDEEKETKTTNKDKEEEKEEKS